jgi:hypothetical protein
LLRKPGKGNYVLDSFQNMIAIQSNRRTALIADCIVHLIVLSMIMRIARYSEFIPHERARKKSLADLERNLSRPSCKWEALLNES